MPEGVAREGEKAREGAMDGCRPLIHHDTRRYIGRLASTPHIGKTPDFFTKILTNRNRHISLNGKRNKVSSSKGREGGREIVMVFLLFSSVLHPLPSREPWSCRDTAPLRATGGETRRISPDSQS